MNMKNCDQRSSMGIYEVECFADIAIQYLAMNTKSTLSTATLMTGSLLALKLAPAMALKLFSLKYTL